MIDWRDWVLLLLYMVSVGCATYVLIAHRKYFAERFRVGVVSAFMLAMLFFLIAYDIKMLVAVWMRSSEVFGYRTPDLYTFQRDLWLFAQIGTAAGLALLAWLTYRNRFDLWIDLRRRDRKGEDK